VAGCVHRLGPEKLEKDLPKRNEFAIFFRLSPDQEALYENFIQVRNPCSQQNLHFSNGIASAPHTPVFALSIKVYFLESKIGKRI
jgi:hypothetical protein